MSIDQQPATEPANPLPDWVPPPPRVRPGEVTAAGVILLVIGGLLTLLGLLFVLSAPLMRDLANDPQFADRIGNDPAGLEAFARTFGIILGIFGAVQLIAGGFVLALRTWARITGMICAVLGAMFALLFVFSGQPVFGTIGFVVVASYGYAFWALTTRGRAFEAP